MEADDLAAMLFNEEICCSFGCCGDLEYAMLLTGDWAGVKPRYWEPVYPEGSLRLVTHPGIDNRERRICTSAGVIRIVAQQDR
jgi:hypothetical protein